MGNRVEPKTFMIGYSTIDMASLEQYLQETGNMDFLDSVRAAREAGLADGEIVASFYAKVCYASLSLGHNTNVTRVRDIPDNLVACMNAGHGSVFGHCNLHFITTRCSRVLTHELVRNHIGTEFSQTSGRYCRLDSIDVVWDPILDGCEDLADAVVFEMEKFVYLAECKKGLRVPNPHSPLATPYLCYAYHHGPGLGWDDVHPDMKTTHDNSRWVPNTDPKMKFDFKKKVTSAIRRFAPNGQSNEIGWSINLRALRHVIQMRTSRHAEREIRLVMNQVYDLVTAKLPMIFCDAKIREFDGLREIYGMRTQPYAPAPGDTQLLVDFTDEQIAAELRRRDDAKEG